MYSQSCMIILALYVRVPACVLKSFRIKPLTHWAIQISNHAIGQDNRLELQTVDPFMAVVDRSLVFIRAANGTYSPINKTKTIPQGGLLY